MLEKIFDTIKENLKNPKFYIGVLLVGIVFLLLFPYIDANYFYYNRVEKRISILKQILDISEEQVKNNPVLEDEYQSILTEISKQKDGSLGALFITNNTPRVNWIKFITGGIIAWLLSIICLFIKTEKGWYKPIGFFIFVLLGIVLGAISVKIPTIISSICNYIFVPALQCVIVGLLVTSGKK